METLDLDSRIVQGFVPGCELGFVCFVVRTVFLAQRQGKNNEITSLKFHKINF